MQRALLGIIALVFLTGGLGLLFSPLPDYWSESVAPVALRVGLLLGALWLALPQVQQVLRHLSPGTLIVLGLLALVAVMRPGKLLVYLAPLLLVLVVLQFLGRLTAPPPRRR